MQAGEQGKPWYNPVRVQSKNQGAYSVTSGVRPNMRERTEKGKGKRKTLVYFLESEGPQTRNSDVQGQEKTDVRGQKERERGIYPPSTFLLRSGPHQSG